METYVLTAPVFDFGTPIETIGDRKATHSIDIPIPHAFVKSVFTEHKDGGFKLWTFKIDNEKQNGNLADYLIKTYDAEQYVGGRFWDRVSGGDLHKQKKESGEMWASKDGDTGELTKSSLKKLKEVDVVNIAISLGISASVDDSKDETIDKIIAKLS